MSEREDNLETKLTDYLRAEFPNDDRKQAELRQFYTDLKQQLTDNQNTFVKNEDEYNIMSEPQKVIYSILLLHTGTLNDQYLNPRLVDNFKQNNITLIGLAGVWSQFKWVTQTKMQLFTSFLILLCCIIYAFFLIRGMNKKRKQLNIKSFFGILTTKIPPKTLNSDKTTEKNKERILKKELLANMFLLLFLLVIIIITIYYWGHSYLYDFKDEKEIYKNMYEALPQENVAKIVQHLKYEINRQKNN